MKIGIWGDSITYGDGDSEALGWVGRLRKKIEATDDLAEIYNLGVCGDTSKELLERFALEADSIHPDSITFAVGTNDAKYPIGYETNKIPLEEFKENMQLLVEQAKTYTNNIYIVGILKTGTVPPSSSGSRFSNDDIRRYNEFLKELSEKRKACVYRCIRYARPYE